MKAPDARRFRLRQERSEVLYHRKTKDLGALQLLNCEAIHAVVTSERPFSGQPK